MGGELADAEIWLPSEFLTDDGIPMHNKENLADRFCFPTEFPYEFADSPVNQTDDDDQLAEITRQLSLHRSHQLSSFKKNTWAMAVSPQSTLSQLGSWTGRSPGSSNGGSPNGPSQVCSPPATPPDAYDEAWDLIRQAAGQVAKLQMDGADMGVDRNCLSLHHRPTPILNNSNGALYDAYVHQARVEQVVRQRLQRMQQRCATWSNGPMKDGWAYRQQMAQARPCMIVDAEDCARREAAWPRPHNFRLLNQRSGSGLVVGGVGSGNFGVKKQCAGTGVFLPRPYENNNNNHKYSSHNYNNKSNPAESRKRAVVPPALIPGNVVSAQDNFSDSVDVVDQPQGLPCFDGGYMVDYETLVARRNALLMMHQRRNARPQVSMSRQVGLPQEWMY